MAVFSLKPLAAGTELTHSYIAMELLVAPESTRAVLPRPFPSPSPVVVFVFLLLLLYYSGA